VIKKKIYLIQPTYQDPRGKPHQGERLIYSSLALPALSATIPLEWEKEFCIEYFGNVDYATDASVVGISSMGYDILHGGEIAAEFKRRGKVILFGGTQAHFSTKRLAAVCDSIVHGNPGPREMKSILDDVTNGTLRAEYHCGMDANFPFDYSVLSGKPLQFIPVLTSVGCKENCDFCCTAAICGGKYRLRKIDVVISDIRKARRLGRDIVFSDSNIFNNRDYLGRLCSRIIDEKLNLRWGAQCTIDIGDDIELLELLKRSGCLVLLVGVETLDQRNMDAVNKRMSTARHRERIRNIRDAGIVVGGYFVLGMDYDSTASYDELFNFIHDSPIDLPILNILIPAPGTRLFDRLENEGRILIRDEDEFLKNNARYATASSHCFYNPQRMSAQETEHEFRRLYGRLTSYREIIRRSIHPHPFTMAMLFELNLEMRRDYQAMLDGANGVTKSTSDVTSA
jgi:uncharacterized radical SAM superfamily protein